MKAKDIFRLAGILLTVTALMAALLAGVNLLTREPIAATRQEKLLKAIEAVLPGASAPVAFPCSDPNNVIRSVYRTPQGYAVEAAPAGFGGTISLMVGLSPSGEVLGISVISHSETPGLGAVAAADTAAGEAFRSQFKNQTPPLAVTQDAGQLDAISGATVTSRAIAAGVNAAAEYVMGLEGTK